MGGLIHSMFSWLLPETLSTKTHVLLSESTINFLLTEIQGEVFKIKISTEKKWKEFLWAD